jgi:hypothetical protein
VVAPIYLCSSSRTCRYALREADRVRATPSDLERLKRGIESQETQLSGFRDGACKVSSGWATSTAVMLQLWLADCSEVTNPSAQIPTGPPEFVHADTKSGQSAEASRLFKPSAHRVRWDSEAPK